MRCVSLTWKRPECGPRIVGTPGDAAMLVYMKEHDVPTAAQLVRRSETEWRARDGGGSESDRGKTWLPSRAFVGRDRVH